MEYHQAASLMLLSARIVFLAAILQISHCTGAQSGIPRAGRSATHREYQERVVQTVLSRLVEVDIDNANSATTGTAGAGLTPHQQADPFNCPSLPARNATSTSVHSLHPQDVKVVMAMGDSLTAGFGEMGVQGLEHDLLEWRGWSFSMGGAPNASTIPAYLKRYNPDLIGMSLGEHTWEFCWGLICPERRHPELDRLNAAQSFAMMYNLANGKGNQLSYLIEQLKADSRIDFENDWKVLSIYIGSNDMCAGCDNSTAWQPVTYKLYKQYFRQVLTGLKAGIPRLFVNVVQLMHVSVVHNATLHSEYCRSMHKSIFEWECSCAFSDTPDGLVMRQKMDNLTDLYNLALEEVVAEISAEKSDTFAAVIQPGFTQPVNETFPISFLSTIDCFHPSLAAHIAMAKVLWNNMLSPKDKKLSTFDYQAPFMCPTADSVFPTG
ncbi:phospholipase B1, membrane-associated-like [Sycon ciliatum]|uniref:phospholipase B1, membrane-associated-like n=1 Tax=Sycon ciliatum TaxID=27933 RepID=UPI0020AA55E1|eukprot:scpid59356/ scgid31444/ Phospholipase B1, membrane-associated; Phospholipase B/lipase; Phospholipase A2; Lysophospholipase